VSAGVLTNGQMKCRIMPQVAMLDGDGRLGVNSASSESRVGLRGRGVDLRGLEGQRSRQRQLQPRLGLTGQMSQRIAMAPQQPGRLK